MGTRPRLELFIAIAFAGCADPFDHHPWEVDVPEELEHLHATAIPAVRQAIGSDSTFRFAVVGDPQLYYGELDEIMDAVEARDDLHFALVVGDLTDQGLAQEFQWYADVAYGRDLPVVSLIGNHDHLGSGRIIYQEMFGERNFSFMAGGARFICFDNVEFESDAPVRYDWLSAQLEQPFDGPTLLFMHIHPTDVQLVGAPLAQLQAILFAHPADAAFMGHLHGYAVSELPGGTPWATAPWVRADAYLEVEVRPDTVFHQLVHVP
ncbi:MAG: metallophosphoesterase [Flavobacteriales bacterium]|nr:metallophosphoesterase [Flavobacteriales bacterium]MCB9201172.1 metallophosphoesterase [Flavobacteriales bacterium]HRW89870.1 metallophosphoesterase [Flavobacteriales bacterium]